MKIIDNSEVLHYNKTGDDSTFLPAATFAFTNSTKTLVVTEAGSVPAGDTFERMNIEVYDRNGDKKTASISAEDGTASIDLDAAPALDLTGKIKMLITVTTAKNLSKDGSYHDLIPIADATGSVLFEK